jgi:hypothetical protein
MVSMWIGFSACMTLIGLIILWCSRIRKPFYDYRYKRAFAAWKADYEKWQAENPDADSWTYRVSKPREWSPGYGGDEGWGILCILLTLVAIGFMCVAILVPVTRGYDSRQCGRKATEFERDTKFVVYGSGWSWQCLVRSRDGKWIPVDSLTEIRGDIVTHEGTPDNG